MYLLARKPSFAQKLYNPDKSQPTQLLLRTFKPSLEHFRGSNVFLNQDLKQIQGFIIHDQTKKNRQTDRDYN